MQEDKNLKKLLQEFSIEEPSSNFNNAVMKAIAANAFIKEPQPLISSSLLKLLKIAFLIIAIAIVFFIAFNANTNFKMLFSSNVNETLYTQLFNFLIVFWVVMLINIGVNKRWKIGNKDY